MKGKLNLYYDEAGDYLALYVGEPRPSYGEELDNGVTLFHDEETDEIVGIAILRFRERAESLKDISFLLPCDIQFLASA